MMKELQHMTTDEVLALLDAGEDVNIIDIREDFEVAMGTIPQAVHIPMQEVPARLDEFDPETPYILICRSGNRTYHLGQYMAARGYTVINMLGGIIDWRGDIETRMEILED